MQRSRAWVFTINNYTDDDEAGIAMCGAQYTVYGKEVGEQGTPHLQGYMYFKSQRTMKSISKKLPRAFLDVRRGSHEQAREYCVKDGDFMEFGTPPEKNGGDQLVDRLQKNKRMRENSIEESVDNGDISFLQIKKLKECKLVLAQEGEPYTAEDVRGLWVYGPPGTGKTHYARSLDENLFIKSQNKWWDGYSGQWVVVLDDLDQQGACLGHHLKIWADKWACTGEVKGGTVNLKHRRFVVTSNYTPAELWPEDETMRKAIERRFEMKQLLIKYT